MFDLYQITIKDRPMEEFEAHVYFNLLGQEIRYLDINPMFLQNLSKYDLIATSL